MVYVLDGQIQVGDKELKAFQLATFEDTGDSLVIETINPAQALILAGRPLNERVAFGGPFVMNTQLEIAQAYSDFENGLFGKIK